MPTSRSASALLAQTSRAAASSWEPCRALRRRGGLDHPSDHAGARRRRRSARDGARRERHLPELLGLHAGDGRTCKCSQRDGGRAGILWSRTVLHGELESGLLRCLRSTTRTPHTAPATARLTVGVLPTFFGAEAGV